MQRRACNETASCPSTQKLPWNFQKRTKSLLTGRANLRSGRYPRIVLRPTEHDLQSGRARYVKLSFPWWLRRSRHLRHWSVSVTLCYQAKLSEKRSAPARQPRVTQHDRVVHFQGGSFESIRLRSVWPLHGGLRLFADCSSRRIEIPSYARRNS